MTDVWGASGAGSRTGWRTWLRDRLVGIPLVCGLSAGAVFVATLLPAGAPAGADQVADLQAQAAQLSHEMLLEQLQIGGYQQQRSADVAQALQDQQVLASTQAQILATHQRIGHDMAVLDRAAVRAYVDAGTAAVGADPLFANDRVAATSVVYEGVVTGQLSDALDQLRTDHHALAAEESTQQSLVDQAQQTTSQADSLLSDAESTQQTLQSQSAEVNGQLAAAVAQQQAAEQAAAAAAVAAAQAKAAARSSQSAGSAGPVAPGAGSAVASAAPASSASSASSASTVTPTLPPFLVCVVQAESGGDYGAVSPTGSYMGAFQFSQSTWNEAAQLAGRPTLIGVPPNTASPADQDALAIALYSADGEAPWYDPCRSG